MYDNLLNCLLSVRVRYVPLFLTISQWLKQSRTRYRSVSMEEIQTDIKTSDTVFVLGGSQSINDITDTEWQIIKKCDSIGMNWWPLHKFTPTYYYTNYPREKHHFERFCKILGRNLHNYGRTVFLISGNRAVRRGIHPRILPDFFPDNAICCFYKYREPIKLDPGKGDVDQEMFARTLYYRGGLSLVLDLMNRLKYKKIVLMGVDLRDSIHFYDDLPEMQWQFAEGYSKAVSQKRSIPHGTMSNKSNSKLPMDKFLYIVNDLYFKPNNIQLFVGSDKSILASRIPVYKFPLS